MENFFRIQTLNGEYSIKTYDRANSSSSCSINVKGAFDNSLFPPFITKNTSLNIFVSELCRVIPLHYQREETKQDLNGYRYVLQRPNEKECLPVENGKPLPKDMYDMSKCVNNDIPTAFSAPHFYGSSYNWSENFEGLNPNAEEHEAYILLLPMMGIPINNNLRFQSNMVLPDLSYLDNKLSHLSNKIMPRLWYDFEMGKLPFIVHFVMYTNILQRMVMILPPLAALWSLNKIIKIRRQFNYKTINNTYNQQKANI
ncbi:sensory neuron membrane protein 2-like isoform X2 [Drosophila albomicans]|nr:sensory neuron membrane protein 2-like isoform X2 [Drosophila albomicans]XP_051862050.1 sensory neuron membrane protein 2-like isoform X2 [Drosophila albomicans]